MTTVLESHNNDISLKGLNPILSCIHNIQDTQNNIQENNSKYFKSLSLKYLKNEQWLKSEEGFCLAISLQDGTTLYVTSSVKTILGYPENVLVGECIMKFLYPPDCIAFAEHLTQGLNHCFTENENGNVTQTPYTFYCRIRYNQTKKFDNCNQQIQYLPFQITAHIDSLAFMEKNSIICLVAEVIPVVSAYKVPGEIPAMTFSTRHTVSCHFSHVDNSAVPYLGYLPQDMIGYSVFDFYHVDDMPQLKDIYELVVKEQGCSFRSKPYRFRVFNGCYITIETEWSCFINPWSYKLEFVVGQHRVLKGPENIDVFKQSSKEITIAEEILKESERIQEEIKSILSQPIKTCLSKHRNDKWKRELSSDINCLINDVKKERNEEKDDQAGNEGCSCSDQGSVLMGEISPHQEFNDSDPLSETPPSFQEMRFKENIERFFASHPKTYSSDGSGGGKCEERQTPNMITDEENGKITDEKDKHFIHCTKSSGRYDCRIQASSCGSSKWKMSSVTTADSGNGSLQTVERMQPMDSSSGSSSRGSYDNYPPCQTLTEQVLSQHNRMTHKHLKQRKSILSSSSGGLTRKENHRLKRSGSPQSCEHTTGVHKHSKTNRGQMVSTVTVPTQTDASLPVSFNLASPFSFPGYPIVAQPPTSHSTTVNSSTSSSVYPPSLANFAIPVYGYLPPSNTSATPFFMPVMYMGAVPCYPSISTMIPHSGHWQCDGKTSEQPKQVNGGINTSNNNSNISQSYNTSSSKQNFKKFEKTCVAPVEKCTNVVATTESKTETNKEVSNNENTKDIKLNNNKQIKNKKAENSKTAKERQIHKNAELQGENEGDKDQEDTTLSFISSLLKSDDLSSHSPSDHAEVIYYFELIYKLSQVKTSCASKDLARLSQHSNRRLRGPLESLMIFNYIRI
ncbi:period circadian protein-like isoform X1 [Centruroides sculpturatus]|uniref:period circadian protein-like isoform X1 n=2 Tax=Centruroides sculpturatus TaxID=218467 RepID=UPI000C6ED5AC|nr:period circadian protein-like isoform X1 [Centruroides sculpturatus]XP_023220144.1 period circadian protein-like isoform X1 [Centruroides sculpturatus]XP_023220145.1 period circadian protein-like isoform X1 [Centruroides sculpturatus]